MKEISYISNDISIDTRCQKSTFRCWVKSCDALVLLDMSRSVFLEKPSDINFGMRNFKYVNRIKNTLEKECPSIVSCVDIVAPSAKDGVVMLREPRVELKIGGSDIQEGSVAVLGPR